MTIFKKRIQSIIAIVGVFSFTLLPFNTVFAIEGQTTTETSTSQTTTKKEEAKTAIKQSAVKVEATRTAHTCQAIDQLATKIQNQLSERKAKVDSARIDIYVKTTAHRESRDTELANKRAGWDAKRQENFDTLRSKAKTDEQKQAVEDYVTAVTGAIKTRRAANDIAFATFRSDVDNLKKTFSESVDVNISTATASINQAISDAKTACENGQSSDTVKQTLKSAIENARQQSKANRESITKSNQLKAIAQKRNDAIKANDDVFKTATAAAREKLKAAFSGN